MDENASGPESGVVVRKMVPSDARDAAELSAELGYPVAPAEMKARLEQFALLEDHAVCAACLDDRVIGWIDVGIVHHLQSQSYGEIGGLIVSGKYQGRGIGRRLVQAAEKWIASQRIAKVLVRSQIARESAHTFYLRQGFSRVKTSAVFTKSLELTELQNTMAGDRRKV